MCTVCYYTAGQTFPIIDYEYQCFKKAFCIMVRLILRVCMVVARVRVGIREVMEMYNHCNLYLLLNESALVVPPPSKFAFNIKWCKHKMVHTAIAHGAYIWCIYLSYCTDIYCSEIKFNVLRYNMPISNARTR